MKIFSVLSEANFQVLQNAFIDKYYSEFDDSEENKFCYTDIHNEYVQQVERYLEEQLTLRIPGFSMVEFSQQLQ